MIANIRTLVNGETKLVCQLDLLKHTREAVLNRMEQKGYRDDNFTIFGFADWGVDTQMTVKEAYLLKMMLTDFYNGDEYVICQLLKAHKPLSFVLLHFYRFCTKDEVELMQQLLKGAEMNRVVEFFYHAGSWVGALQAYIEKGIVLNTPKGFYLEVE